MGSAYLVDNTARTLRIKINPGESDGPGGVTRNTDIRLFGEGAPNWGESVDENFLRILESFAHPEDPLNPGNPDPSIITDPQPGQLWFNYNAVGSPIVPGELYVCVSVTGSPPTATWRIASGVVVDSNEPPSPNLGDLWYDVVQGQLKVWVGGSPGWESVAERYVLKSGDTMTGFLTLNADPVNPLHAATKSYTDDVTTELQKAVPPGLGPLPWAGVSGSPPAPNAPPGWLLCDGSSYATATYPQLFAAIGYTYGGSGPNFLVPDMSGRIPLGADNMSGTPAGNVSASYAVTIGGTGGDDIHELVVPELPDHTHIASSSLEGSHTHSGTTASAGSHSHTTSSAGSHSHSGSTTDSAGVHSHTGWVQTASTGASGDDKNVQNVFGSTDTAGAHTHNISSLSTDGVHTHTINTAGAHTHTFTTGAGTSHNHTITVSGGGSGSLIGDPHNNMPPVMTFSYIIKADF